MMCVRRRTVLHLTTVTTSSSLIPLLPLLQEATEDADVTDFTDRKVFLQREASRQLLDGSSDEDDGGDGEEQGGGFDDDGDGTNRRSPASRRPAAARPPEDRSTIRLLPMHSLIAFDDQMAAFDKENIKVDRRTRVVIATNIAESSITLPDVHTVIDLGRSKTMEYVPRMKASMLRSTWISQASAQQRSGRAGRLCPGTCFRLYTRRFHDNVMPRYDIPEMLRLTLDSVVLKVKILGIQSDAAVARAIADGVDPSEADAAVAHSGLGDRYADLAGRKVNSAKAVLGQSIQPPDGSNVDSALVKLAALGALHSASDVAEVTTFGKTLASFPGEYACMHVAGVLVRTAWDFILHLPSIHANVRCLTLSRAPPFSLPFPCLSQATCPWASWCPSAPSSTACPTRSSWRRAWPFQTSSSCRTGQSQSQSRSTRNWWPRSLAVNGCWASTA